MLNFSFPLHDSLACLNMHRGGKYYYTFHCALIKTTNTSSPDE